MIIQWQKAPYRRDVWYCDVDWGRYLVKRTEKGSRVFRVYLDGLPTSYFGSADLCKQAVECILTQRDVVGGAS